MNPDWYKYFNYGSIIVIAVLLILVLTLQLERDHYIALLFIAIALLIFRVVFRIYFYVKTRKVNEE